MEKIGLIAGRGNFPLLFAGEAKKKGFFVCAVAVKANTRRQLKNYVDKIYWIGVTEFKRIAGLFKQEGIQRVAMAGQINPHSLFNPRVMSSPDVQDFFGRIEDRRADTIFKAFTANIEGAGLQLVDSTLFLAEYMPKSGVLTARKPSAGESKDMDFGFKIAKHMGAMDIGQSVCVKNGVILAVESIEGTDNTIRRASGLAGSALVLVKTAKPSQDMRFDVPVVGRMTVKNLPKGSCLAIEAGKVLFLERAQALKLADRKGISITAKNS